MAMHELVQSQAKAGSHHPHLPLLEGLLRVGLLVVLLLQLDLDV